MSRYPLDDQGWTPVQIVQLMRLSRMNWSARQIAVRIGRLEASVQLKARQQRISLSP
jgi:hypothetical protein